MPRLPSGRGHCLGVPAGPAGFCGSSARVAGVAAGPRPKRASDEADDLEAAGALGGYDLDRVADRMVEQGAGDG
jgi:hypothetical protein